MLHHYWINYTGFQQLKELNIKFLACAMTQSEKLSRLTCLIYFNGTPHPVYCVPLLIPAVFGFQKKRKRFKGGYSSFPIWTLSNGINSPTLCYYILPCIQYKIPLPLNHWPTKPLPISLISSSCMFRHANSVRLPILDSFVFNPLTSGLVVNAPPSVKHHYSGTICSILDTFLP